jgi:hypothetical protein
VIFFWPFLKAYSMAALTSRLEPSFETGLIPKAEVSGKRSRL